MPDRHPARLASRRPDSRPRQGARLPADATRPAPLLFDVEHRPITTRRLGGPRRLESRCPLARIPGRDPPPRRPARSTRCSRKTGADGRRPPARPLRGRAGPAGRGLPARPDRARRRPAAGGGVVLAFDGGLHDPPAGRTGGARGQAHRASPGPERGYVGFCPRCFLWQYGAGRGDSARPPWPGSPPAHPGVTRHGQDALRRPSGRRSAGRPARRRSRPDRGDRALARRQGGALPRRLRRRIRARVSSEGGIGLTLFQLGRPVVSRRGDPPPRLPARPRPGSRAGRPPGLPARSAATRPTATGAGPTSRPLCPSGRSPAPPRPSACSTTARATPSPRWPSADRMNGSTGSCGNDPR